MARASLNTQKDGGISTAKSYPCVVCASGQDESCNMTGKNKMRIMTTADVISAASNGVVSVTVASMNIEWMVYTSAIMNSCSSVALDHAVTTASHDVLDCQLVGMLVERQRHDRLA